MLDVHLKGAFYVTQPAWRAHARAGLRPHRVNTSSAAGIFGNFGQTNYGAAKMGLVGLTRVLAVEGAKYNIKANAIAPLALTRMTEDILGDASATSSARSSSRRSSPSSPTRTATVTGRIFSVGGGRVAEVFIAETPGLLRRRPHARGRRATTGRRSPTRTATASPNNLAEETALFLPFFK